MFFNVSLGGSVVTSVCGMLSIKCTRTAGGWPLFCGVDSSTSHDAVEHQMGRDTEFRALQQSAAAEWLNGRRLLK